MVMNEVALGKTKVSMYFTFVYTTHSSPQSFQRRKKEKRTGKETKRKEMKGGKEGRKEALPHNLSRSCPDKLSFSDNNLLVNPLCFWRRVDSGWKILKAQLLFSFSPS